MKQGKQGAVWLLAMAWGLSGCAGEYGGAADTGNGGPNPGGGSVASERALFDTRVQPTLDFCRSCHVPGGVADSDEGRRFMLASDSSQDYALLRAYWEALGRGVDANLILQHPSGQQPHSGGAPWPQGSAAYTNMRILLGCWDAPANCAALLAGAGGGPVAEAEPLLGNPGRHYFINRLCDGAPDSTPIDWNQDPRRLLTVDGGLIDSEQYAVHFNDPYEICRTETLFETQARQNALRVAQGLDPIYSARPDPATCGEWRAAVQRGHDWVAMTPADQPLEGDQASGDSAMAWNSLWRLWGMSERPADYDLHLFERYGHSPPPPHIYNPYPVVDPAKGIDERP